MIVNSLQFFLFFVVVFTIYYLPIYRNTPKFQNLWLFLTSYFFYGFADWRMVPLLLGATIAFYFIGLWLKSEMEKGQTKNASMITTLGVVLGVGVLVYFKYMNFFADSFAQLLKAIGLNVSWTTLNIVLPIGVSFFTFKLISYIIEVHREHIQPSKDFIEFGTYVTFFPTILSGPIDRPNKFIPQLQGVRQFNYDMAADGCRQVLWGMFTKMCIADNLAPFTDRVWANIDGYSSATLILTSFYYSVQLYADFDGYSNMAIGVAKILNLQVERNFNHPFLARNIAEYWRNWHISLTSWLTDYVFAPLNIAFRYMNNLGIILAIVINFVLIGLWHGADWTFAFFGLYHGLLYIPLILSGSFAKKKKLRPNKIGIPNMKDFSYMLVTFLLVSIGLILFRAESFPQAGEYLSSILKCNDMFNASMLEGKRYIWPVILILGLEWLQRDKQHALQFPSNKLFNCAAVRYLVYAVLVSALFIYAGEVQTFIYFQF